MILKDLSIERKVWVDEDNKPYWSIEGDVIIKRHDKLWRVPCRVGYEISECENEIDIVLRQYFERVKKIYHLWKVNENGDPQTATYPFELFDIKDEEMTKEDFVNKYNIEDPILIKNI